MAVDYSQGRGNIGQLYTNLQNAVASKGEAENRREARDIERKGLFGTGIKQSDLQAFGNIAIKGAELGDARMGQKMDRATKSFDRRMAADERRIASLKERAKGTGGKVYEDLMGQIQGIEMGMGERRNSFEDYMGKYQEKGLWGTKFGGDDVGYRTEGESKYSQAIKQKLSSGDGSGGGSGGGSGPKEFTDARDLGDFDRSPSQPGTDQKFRGGSNIGENAPLGPGRQFNAQSSPGQNEYEEKFGEGSSGMMNLGGSEEDRFGLGGKKKADLGDSVAPTSGGMEGGLPQTSATSNKFTDGPPSGGPPKRDNYSRALRDALPQAGLSAEERAARDAAEKQELLKDKYLVNQKKQEYKDQTDGILAKRQRNLITEALRETDWK